MDTEEILQEFEEQTSGVYLDYDTYYTGTADTLFATEQSVVPITRSRAVDEDLFAQFVEFQLQYGDTLNELQLKIKDLSTKVRICIKRCEAMREFLNRSRDSRKYIKRQKYIQIVEELVRLGGSRAKQKKGAIHGWIIELNEYRNQRNDLLNQVKTLVGDSWSVCWGRYLNLEDPQEYLEKYLSDGLQNFWDPEDFDTQENLVNKSLSFDCIGDEHVLEMLHGEGLVWMDNPPMKENYNVSGFWDWKKQKRTEYRNEDMASLLKMIDEME